MRQQGSSWKLLVLAASLPILVLVAINVSLGDDFHPDSFKRFGNALLTSYVVVGILLIGDDST